jgi:hypothetical protein
MRSARGPEISLYLLTKVLLKGGEQFSGLNL